MANMMAVDWAALFSGLLILVMVVLSVRVVLGRRKHRVLIGDGGVSEMTVTSRIFGNAAEYIPICIAAMILMALTGSPIWAIQLVGGLMLAGRIIHPFGLKATGGVTMPRLIGMALTWTSLVVAVVALVACPLMR